MGTARIEHGLALRQLHPLAWAQSRQTKRPSLWAIIGLHWMPTKQWGQRMIRIVSVRFWISIQTRIALHAWFHAPSR